MNERELEKLPEPGHDHQYRETAVNGAGQEMYRVVNVSAWAVVPNR